MSQAGEQRTGGEDGQEDSLDGGISFGWGWQRHEYASGKS
jgi:hypothetical protein